jgi:hypothetical protein
MLIGFKSFGDTSALFRFVADLPDHPEKNGAMKGKEFVDILIVAVTVTLFLSSHRSFQGDQEDRLQIGRAE